MRWVIGADDSGRGPVIGPMVLAGCLINEELEDELKKLGVKDSKQLTPRRREILAQIIREKADAYELKVISPDEIDAQSFSGVNLNDVEAMAFADIINALNKGRGHLDIIIDCPSPNIEKWKDFLRTKVHHLSNVSISCEHKADQNHVAVSAASVIAKSEREKQMGFLKQEYGNEIGSGYASDPATQKFLEKYAYKHRDKGIFRKSWATYKNMTQMQKQRGLKEFLE